MSDTPFKLVEQDALLPTHRAIDIAGETYALPLPVINHIEDLQLAWEASEGQVEYLAKEMRWFCGRVERGEIRSVRTYTSFKHALMVVHRAELPAIERPDERDQVERENRVGMWSFAVGLLLGVVSTVLLAGWIP